jgi:hypothetical protein
MMEKHFVSFTYPGMIVCGEASESIDSWDVDKAVRMAETRHKRAFAFKFITRRREDNELDSKEIKRSPTYFLGGEVLDEDAVRARSGESMVENMRTNGWARLIVARYGNMQPLENDDVILSCEWA